MPPIVAIVGRPNVGKSTLFNRLARRQQAITHDRPGVTRDRLEVRVELDGRAATLIDTGGMDFDAPEGLARQIVVQAEIALDMADVVLFLVDGKAGRTALDDELAERLRRVNKPVLVAVNKVDGIERIPAMTGDFHAWGFPLLPLSAAHGHGQNELEETLARMLPETSESEEPAPLETGLRLAVLGRPNAGKSSLVNALLGEQRLIVSEVAGTTRDAVDIVVERGGKRYVFVDTAGVRKRTRITDGLERYSVAKALGSAKRANVAVVVIDATGGVGVQDKRLIAYLDKERTPFLVAVNKTDLIGQGEMVALRKDIRGGTAHLPPCAGALPVGHEEQGRGQGPAPGRGPLEGMPDPGGHGRTEPGHAHGARQASAAPRQQPAGQVLLPDPGQRRAPDLCLFCQRCGPGAGVLRQIPGKRLAQAVQHQHGPGQGGAARQPLRTIRLGARGRGREEASGGQRAPALWKPRKVERGGLVLVPRPKILSLL